MGTPTPGPGGDPDDPHPDAEPDRPDDADDPGGGEQETDDGGAGGAVRGEGDEDGRADGPPARATTPPGADEPPTAFADVYLITSGPDGPTAVPGLRLAFGRGVSLSKADGAVVWERPWADVSEMATAGTTEVPGDGIGLVLDVTDAWRSHRFVIPAADPQAVEDELAALGARRGPTRRPGHRALRFAVAVAVVAVAGAAAAVLLLAAGHVVHLRL